MKGQGSIEYMSILAAVLVVFAAVTHSQMIEPARTTARNTEELAEARIACDKIAAAINTVYNPFSEGSRTLESVEFPHLGGLEITRDNVQMSILYEGKRMWVGSSIEYDNLGISLSDTPRGSYTVIVEWNTDEPEGVEHVKDEDEIYINIKPGGG